MRCKFCKKIVETPIRCACKHVLCLDCARRMASCYGLRFPALACNFQCIKCLPLDRSIQRLVQKIDDK